MYAMLFQTPVMHLLEDDHAIYYLTYVYLLLAVPIVILPLFLGATTI